jgi:hypothetical protein
MVSTHQPSDMYRPLPPGATLFDALYAPGKVTRLRRQQRERAQGPGYTTAEFAALVRKYRGRCVGCGKGGLKLQADHVIPIAKGGPHHIRNIQPLCKKCNFAKGTRTDDYRRSDVARWLREIRGRCVYGKLAGEHCKNLAVLDGGRRLCHVHDRLCR